MATRTSAPPQWYRWLVRTVIAAVLVTSAPLLHGTPTASAGGLGPGQYCDPDVLFIGARGSGESADSHEGLGDTVNNVYEKVKAKVERAGGRIGFTSTIYPAQNVDTLSLLVTGNNAYFDGLEQGVVDTLDTLRLASKCDGQRIVLGGYSQGAMVMHRVLKRLDPRKDKVILDRIDAAVLVADGDRVTGDSTRNFGDADPKGHGIGVEKPSLSGSQSFKFSGTSGKKVFSICRAGDSVCAVKDALSWVPGLATGVAIHTQYTTNPDAQRFIGQAVDAITFKYPKDASVKWDKTPTLTGTVGDEVYWTLNATVPKRCNLDFSIGKRGTLPEGLHLNENTIMGTLMAEGKSTTPLVATANCRVRGTKSASQTIKFEIQKRPDGPPEPPTSPREVVPITGLGAAGGIAIDSAGNIIVVDRENNRVVRFNPTTKQQSDLPFTGLNMPIGVALDSSGAVYVTDTGNNRVLKLPSGSNNQSVLPFTGLDFPYDVTVDKSGNVFVTGVGPAGQVVKLDSRSGVQGAMPFTGIKESHGVKVAKNGDIYVVDQGNAQVLRFPVGATTPQVLPFSGLKWPAALAVTDAGDVLITDLGAPDVKGRVLRLAAGATSATVLPFGELWAPAGVVVDRTGSVYVSENASSTSGSVYRLPAGS